MAIIRNNLITNYHLTAPPQNVIQWGMDARRAVILFRRLKNASDQSDVKIFGSNSPDTSDHSDITPYRDELEEKRSGFVFGEGSPNTAEHSNFTTKPFSQLEDYVAIIDLDSKGRDNSYEVIKLPFIPKELEYNCESSFAPIRPIGRNNPMYHFTGAEDKVEFEIDWYAHDFARREVIEKCRKIESLSKADAYSGNPHRVKILWGKENVLFAEHEFIVLSASYKLTQFNKGYIHPGGELTPTHMLPIQAYQKVILARITRENLSKVEIEYVSLSTIASKSPELVSSRDYQLK